MMPPRPTVAVSTVAPLCMTATIDTMPVCGKYMCSISSPTSCSITPRSSAIVRRCGASREKSCGGNAAKNRFNFPCSNRRVTGGVLYGIDALLLLGGDALADQRQVRIEFYVRKSSLDAPRRHRTTLYHPPCSTTRCGGERRGGLFATR